MKRFAFLVVVCLSVACGGTEGTSLDAIDVPGVDADAGDTGGEAKPEISFEDDQDEDGVFDSQDNCPSTANPAQKDDDADGVGNACDPCIGPNTDMDGDEVLDCNDDCPHDPDNDLDGDGTCGDVDNCPEDSNATQGDKDDDGFGDVCDPCPDSPNHDDTDQDGTLDCKDGCPVDPAKTEPGVCGCGFVDTDDTDEDGTLDCLDECPLDPDDDKDNDDVCGDVDNCPVVKNESQMDTDDDGRGDACDACKFDAANDFDSDLVCGDVDNCPLESNPDQADTDNDGIGDACDPDWIECLDPSDCFDDFDCTQDTCVGGFCVHDTNDDFCDDENPCTDDVCTSDAGCLSDPNTASCDDQNDCTTVDLCEDGACVGTQNECQCETDVDCVEQEDGSLCNGTLKCVGNECQVDPNTVVTCEPSANPCIVTSCDSISGDCVGLYAVADTACDDGDVCTPLQQCEAGECVGSGAISCDDQNVCTDDWCDPTLGCQHDSNSESCDDGDACTEVDTCVEGKCAGGDGPDCDDDNDCTADSCESSTGCVTQDITGPCSDGNACTENDACSAGACVGGAAKVCDDGNVCTSNTCNPSSGCVFAAANEGGECSDGNVCSEQDKCASGVCVGGPTLDCDDNQTCTSDTCVPGVGCVNSNIPGSCDDGNACTEGDTCSNGACSAGTTKTCDDGNVCTSNECNPTTGCGFSPTNENQPCQDGNDCTVNDICQSGTCKGVGQVCNDNNPCTDDRCDQAHGGCYTVFNTVPCDDGNLCTKNDTCSLGACTAGIATVCNDGNACTDDACNPSTGACTYSNDNTNACTDGNACTQVDACVSGSCVGSSPRTCDDGKPCTDDTCNPSTGSCAYANDNSNTCSDNNLCTQTDACVSGACVGSNTKVCNDGNVCTDDTCVPATGTCSTTFNTKSCDDGDGCTVGDVCYLGSCKAGAPNDCHEGDACTVDTCVAGACVHTKRSGKILDGISSVRGVLPRDDGSFVVSGTTIPAAGATADPWIAHVFAKGTLDWENVVDSSLQAGAKGVVASPSGGFVVLTSETDTAGMTNAGLYGLDASGGPLWQKSFGGASLDSGWGLVSVSDGYVVGGYTWSIGAGKNDAWLFRTNLVGQAIWEKAYGGIDKDEALDLVAVNSGASGFALCGALRTGDYDGWLVRVDSNGTKLWEKSYGSSTSNGFLYGIVTLASGGFGLAGLENTTASGMQAWFIRTDASGTVVGETRYGGTGWDEFREVAAHPQGGYILGGSKAGTGESTPGHLWVVRTTDTGAVTWEWESGSTVSGNFVFNLVGLEENGVFLSGTQGGLGYWKFLNAQGKECVAP